MIDLKQGDCLELMKDIPDNSIDMILCDLPYGTTDNKWDKKIDIKKLFQEYERIVKRGGGGQQFYSLSSLLLLNSLQLGKNVFAMNGCGLNH